MYSAPPQLLLPSCSKLYSLNFLIVYKHLSGYCVLHDTLQFVRLCIPRIHNTHVSYSISFQLVVRVPLGVCLLHEVLRKIFVKKNVLLTVRLRDYVRYIRRRC